MVDLRSKKWKAFRDRSLVEANGLIAWKQVTGKSYFFLFILGWHFSVLTIKGTRNLPVYLVSLVLYTSFESKRVAYKVKTAFDKDQVFVSARNFQPVVTHSPQFRPMNTPDRTISRQNCARKERQRPHCAGKTNPSRKRRILKTPVKPGEFENADYEF